MSITVVRGAPEAVANFASGYPLKCGKDRLPADRRLWNVKADKPLMLKTVVFHYHCFRETVVVRYP